jgi:hypothetical protein
MDERQCFMGPFIVAQLTERQHTDTELSRAMHNVLSAQITKLSATIPMLSVGSQTYRAQERVGQSLLLRPCVCLQYVEARAAVGGGTGVRARVRPGEHHAFPQG